jgi:hypothetical protein
MWSPFKHIKCWEQKILITVICLELLKTLVIPNPIDVLILIGLIIIFFSWYGNGW